MTTKKPIRVTIRRWLPSRERLHAARGRRDETGASLIMVLVFMVVAGLMVGALADAASNDLGNTINFKSARNIQWDAQTAVNEAIQSIRYTPLITSQANTLDTLNASPPVACWGNVGSLSTYFDSSDSTTVAVWCSTAWYPASAATRVVTLSACVSTESAASCAAQPLLQATVSFDDYPLGGTTPPSKVPCFTYCGTTMTVDGYLEYPRLPTVTSVGVSSGVACPTAATGPVTGGTRITICGTGFVVGDTSVNFVEESNGTPASDNTVCTSNSQLTTACTVTSVTVNSSTSITATAPTVTEGSTYFVTVTTPTGTSAYANNVFTYTAVTPTLATATPISPNTGETVGGTAITIIGTGFVASSTDAPPAVAFVPTAGGASVPAKYVTAPTINNGGFSQITAVAPGISSGSLSYYVEVTTAGGTTATSSADIFTYTVTTPVVSGISVGTGGTCCGAESLTGSPGTQLTIWGTSFWTGETVAFTEESGGQSEGATIAGITPAVQSSDQMTVTVPTPTVGSQYLVEVTTPNTNGTTNSTTPCSTSTGCTSSNTIVYSYTPTVTSISPTTSAAGSTVTITGNYFANDGGNPTVSFLEENGGSLANPTVTVPATNVQVRSYTQITATVPTIAAGTTYYVTVTTPAGPSWTSGSATPPPIFTYAAPTVTGLNPTSSANANATITVAGTDFYTSVSTVAFVPVGGGAAIAGTNVVITSSTQLSVKAPALTLNTPYYVEVTTPAGTSTGSTSSKYTYT